MPVEFIGKPIEVELSGEPAGAPVTFRLGRKEYKVAEVLQHWEDHSIREGMPGRGDWRSLDWLPTRRHGKRRQEKSKWFAHRKL
ncbi:MAG: hypothetical protein AMJ77_00775 [Dehalococcoidia bacterium SM23_28_2]|nr:MAG: hypothetical protein AMJ77_00775 [Dehalococcoidia bacterium SM23_28_2]